MIVLRQKASADGVTNLPEKRVTHWKYPKSIICRKMWIHFFCPSQMCEPQLSLTRCSVCNSNLFAEALRCNQHGGAKTQATHIRATRSPTQHTAYTVHNTCRTTHTHAVCVRYVDLQCARRWVEYELAYKEKNTIRPLWTFMFHNSESQWVKLYEQMRNTTVEVRWNNSLWLNIQVGLNEL